MSAAWFWGKRRWNLQAAGENLRAPIATKNSRTKRAFELERPPVRVGIYILEQTFLSLVL